jgi:hypothetical protein
MNGEGRPKLHDQCSPFCRVPWRNTEIFAKFLEIAVSVVMTFYQLMIFVRLVYVWYFIHRKWIITILYLYLKRLKFSSRHFLLSCDSVVNKMTGLEAVRLGFAYRGSVIFISFPKLPGRL